MDQFTCGIAQLIYTRWAQRFLPEDALLLKQLRDAEQPENGNRGRNPEPEAAKVIREKLRQIRQDMKVAAISAAIAAEAYVEANEVAPDPKDRIYGTAELLFADAASARIRELAELRIRGADAALIASKITEITELAKAAYTAAEALNTHHEEQ